MSEMETAPGATNAEGSETTATSMSSIRTRRDNSRASQLPPAGPAPNAEELFVSALLWATPEQVLTARRTIAPDDFHQPYREIVDACLTLAVEGGTGAVLVQDYMRRTGTFSDAVRRHLDALVVAGGTGHSLPLLAAAVLANKFRERADDLGRAIVAAAGNEPEAELWAVVATGEARLRTAWESLQTARRWTS